MASFLKSVVPKKVWRHRENREDSNQVNVRGETSERIRYAESIIQKGTLLRKEQGGEPAIYEIPLSKVVILRDTYHAYFFGEESEMYGHHKVIMMVGETGTGKSTLINALINYILGVEWEDEFRFKIINEQGEGQRSQVHSQTQIISSYTIRSNEHHNIPYTLTIIDTPGFGDTRGIERDKAIVDQIRGFFSNEEHHQVDHIDGICFVVRATDSRLTPTQRYVFESILSLFGRDVEPNILLLATHCEAKGLPVIDAIKAANIPCNTTEFKFSNIGLYGKNKKSTSDHDPDEEMDIAFDRSHWQVGNQTLRKFFETLDQLSPKSLTLTKDVLEERKRLENTAEKFEPQIKMANSQLEKLEKEKALLEQNKQEIEANKSFVYEVEVTKWKKTKTIYRGIYCNNCHFSCHHPCRREGSKIPKCRAMLHGNCIVCPKKCSSEDHSSVNFQIEYITVREKQTYADIKQRYEDAAGKMLTNREVVQKLEADLEYTKKAVCELIDESNRCMNRLREIALKPHPLGIMEYIDLMIEREKSAINPGWQSRVKRYEELKQKESFVSSDSKGVFGRLWSTITRQ